MNGRHIHLRSLGEDSSPIRRVKAARQTPMRVKTASLDQAVAGLWVVLGMEWERSVASGAALATATMMRNSRGNSIGVIVRAKVTRALVA